MTASLSHAGSTTTSISVNYSFTSQSQDITKVTVFCEEYNPEGTIYDAKSVTFTATKNYSNSTTFYGLATNRQHKLYARSFNSSGGQVEQSNIIYPYTSAPPPPPPPPSGVGVIGFVSNKANSVTISWSAASGAEYYAVEYRPNGTSTWISSNFFVTGTSHEVTGLDEYKYYDFKVYARNAGGNGAPSTTSSPYRTKDGTAPTLNVSTDGNGKVFASWTASDSHSGLRSTSTFACAINSAGNIGSYVHKAYTTNNYFSFTSDANNLEFTNNTSYGIRIIAYDNEGNETSVYKTITYVITRPQPDWSWHTVKEFGQPISLTAAEWNSFGIKINQFRQYKNLSNYSFTSVSANTTVITADIVNQARTAISPMNPPTPLPPSAVKGVNITASFFNGLAASLNSIT